MWQLLRLLVIGVLSITLSNQQLISLSLQPPCFSVWSVEQLISLPLRARRRGRIRRPGRPYLTQQRVHRGRAHDMDRGRQQRGGSDFRRVAWRRVGGKGGRRVRPRGLRGRRACEGEVRGGRCGMGEEPRLGKCWPAEGQRGRGVRVLGLGLGLRIRV